MPACLSAARDGCQAIWLTPVPGRAARLVLWLASKTSPATRRARSQRLMSLFPANVSPRGTGNDASKRIDHTESGYCSRISGGSARTLVYAHLRFLNISTLIYIYERISARAAEIFSSQPVFPAVSTGCDFWCFQLAECKKQHYCAPLQCLERHPRCIYPPLYWYFATRACPAKPITKPARVWP